MTGQARDEEEDEERGGGEEETCRLWDEERARKETGRIGERGSTTTPATPDDRERARNEEEDEERGGGRRDV